MEVDDRPDDVDTYFVEQEIGLEEKKDGTMVLRLRQNSGYPRMNTLQIKEKSSNPGKRSISVNAVHFESKTSLNGLLKSPLT